MLTKASTGVTNELANFAVATQFADLPKEVIEIAKRCIVDGTACILAGSTEPAAEILRRLAQETGGAQQARTLGQHSHARSSSPGRANQWHVRPCTGLG